MKLSLVIPCYNEVENISLLYASLKEVFSKEKYLVELIFINDGSTDNTICELEKLLKNKDFKIKIIDFSRNFGKEAGIYAGFEHASGDYVGIIDADMQQPPEIILKMLTILENDKKYDAVAAYQLKRKDPFLKRHLSQFFYRAINRVSEVKLTPGASDFRLLRKNVVASILKVKEYYRFSKGIFTWVGYNTYYLEYEPNKRINGKSKWSLKKLFKYAVDGILAYTTSPIRIATWIGLILSILSFIYLVITVIQKIFFGIDVPGYASLLTVVLLLGGIQLLFLGVIGEYIARIYIETKNRPIYIAKNLLTNSKEKE